MKPLSRLLVCLPIALAVLLLTSCFTYPSANWTPRWVYVDPTIDRLTADPEKPLYVRKAERRTQLEKTLEICLKKMGLEHIPADWPRDQLAPLDACMRPYLRKNLNGCGGC
jgi:hypothetical protein